ncbi:MAG: hypothetical protein ABF290_08050, partial [Thiogranum sp.]
MTRAFDRGHYFSLATGCVIGGLLFAVLNEIINDYGGFLRKVSTTIYHLRRQERQNLDAGQTTTCIEEAMTHLGSRGFLPPLRHLERRQASFRAATAQIRRAPLLKHLPAEAAAA